MRTDNTKFRVTVASGMIAALAGCGWAPVFVSRSPTGNAELRILKNPPSSAGSYRFRVELRAAGQRNRLLYSENTDSMVGLVEVHWTAKDKAVGLLACNMIKGPILLAYDLENHAQLPPDALKSALEAQLRLRYALPTSASAVDWACSTDGQVAYARKIGEPGSAR